MRPVVTFLHIRPTWITIVPLDQFPIHESDNSRPGRQLPLRWPYGLGIHSGLLASHRVGLRRGPGARTTGVDTAGARNHA
jgi:hypothetical protein